ncbi:MAG: hypothetical protein ACI9DF_006110, partial [Verrucomicrobiales bacterium]
GSSNLTSHSLPKSEPVGSGLSSFFSPPEIFFSLSGLFSFYPQYIIYQQVTMRDTHLTRIIQVRQNSLSNREDERWR